MKVIIGIVKPTSGEIMRTGSFYYIPQSDLPFFQNNMTLLNYFIESYEEWWKITGIMEKQFGFGKVNINQKLKTLSGGELIKLHLAIALLKNPDCLFLDEPTNHLDIPSIQQLISFLNTYKGAFIIVSHDPFFLDQVTNTTWEIENKTVHKFGGNYSDYKIQKKAQIEAQGRQYHNVKKELNKVKKTMQLEKLRAAKSKRTGREMKHDRGMSTFEKGFFKNKASITAGKNKRKLENIKEETEVQMNSLKAHRQKKAYLELGTISIAIGRTLVRGQRINLGLEDGRYLIEDADISISYGDRIVITGKNGVGKTMFIKSLLGNNTGSKLEGELYLPPDIKIAYLSQKYEIVDPNFSLIENMQKVNPDLTYEQIRKQLGNLLFYKEDDIKKKALILSGGETARLAFAMITAASIDLLVLDEPTNNLDIATIESVIDALKKFNGAIVVISHNIDFLSQIGINTALIINNKKLRKLRTTPANKKDFYKELISEFES